MGHVTYKDKSRPYRDEELTKGLLEDLLDDYRSVREVSRVAGIPRKKLRVLITEYKIDLGKYGIKTKKR